MRLYMNAKYKHMHIHDKIVSKFSCIVSEQGSRWQFTGALSFPMETAGCYSSWVIERIACRRDVQGRYRWWSGPSCFGRARDRRRWPSPVLSTGSERSSSHSSSRTSRYVRLLRCLADLPRPRNENAWDRPPFRGRGNFFWGGSTACDAAFV